MNSDHSIASHAMNTDDAGAESQERIAALFSQHRTRIGAYAYAIVRDYHAVDDVLQDVAMILIRKRDVYDPATPFLPWALAITRRQALAQRRSRPRGTVTLDQEILDRIEAAIADEGEAALQERRMAALAQCLERVGESGAGLLRMKYVEQLSADVIAERTRSSRPAIYSGLQRLRERLASCMEQRLASEPAP